jgi:hypothetical protein
MAAVTRCGTIVGAHRPDRATMSITQAFSNTQVFSRLSVRARIIVLGVIPVVGFLAIGIAYVSGDAEVGSAFAAVHRNTEVAAASRDLKTGLLTMRAATTDFVAHPSNLAISKPVSKALSPSRKRWASTKPKVKPPTS